MLSDVENTQCDRLPAVQCRMAWPGLGLSVTDVSKASLFSNATIIHFESGSKIKLVLRPAPRIPFECLGAVIGA